MDLAPKPGLQVEITCDPSVDGDIASLHAHMETCARAEWPVRLSSWMARPRELMRQRIVSSVSMAVLAGLILGAVAAIF